MIENEKWNILDHVNEVYDELLRDDVEKKIKEIKEHDNDGKTLFSLRSNRDSRKYKNSSR